jgi:hypothetical protein
MLQAKWTGTEDGGDIIFDQTEGEVVHHSYQLPLNFKGELKLKFYTEIGTWQIDPVNFETDDFVLLDNLRLSAIATDAKEQLQDASLLVSPNPTQGRVLLQSDQIINQLSLHNLNGKAIRQLEVGATDYNMDVSALNPGIYLLEIQLANGQWKHEKLVKI